jgi:sugar lactone lactonase YvrE
LPATGAISTGGDGVAAALSGIDPFAIAFSSNGDLYVADQYNNRIRKIAKGAAGLISTVAGNGTLGYGGENGPATSAMLANPASISVAADQSIYVADQGNFRVRKIAPDGTITAFAGSGVKDGGQAIDAYLNFPDGIALDAGANLYIADSGDHRIRKVDATGKITTFAGRGIQGFTDGGQSAKVLLSQAADVAIDSKGNAYIADSGNFRIHKVVSAAKSARLPAPRRKASVAMGTGDGRRHWFGNQPGLRRSGQPVFCGLSFFHVRKIACRNHHHHRG